MATTVTAKWNRAEFDRTMREYRPLTKKLPAQICNNTAYFIARGAARNTPKATKQKIREDLLATGRLPAPIAALLINAQRGRDGLPGLYGRQMKEAVEREIKRRRVATLAAGWIPAIKRLEPLADKRGAPSMGRIQATGKEKGSASPASESSWTAKASITNENQAPWDLLDTAAAIGLPALQQAFDQEQASKRDYIERKYREAAQKAAIKVK